MGLSAMGVCRVWHFFAYWIASIAYMVPFLAFDAVSPRSISMSRVGLREKQGGQYRLKCVNRLFARPHALYFSEYRRITRPIYSTH